MRLRAIALASLVSVGLATSAGATGYKWGGSGWGQTVIKCSFCQGWDRGGDRDWGKKMKKWKKKKWKKKRKKHPPQVPLPATLPLALAGVAGLGLVARRRKDAE